MSSVTGNDIDEGLYDAVTINSDWMVVNDSVMVNHDDTIWWRTLLDRIGYATTPTSGYIESELGSSNVRFHGPFQRRMLLGTADDDDETKETAKYVHLMRFLFVSDSILSDSIGNRHSLCKMSLFRCLLIDNQTVSLRCESVKIRDQLSIRLLRSRFR